MVLYLKRITKALIRLRVCAGWSAPVLFANPRRQVFSRRGPFIISVKCQLAATFSTYNDVLISVDIQVGFIGDRHKLYKL